MRPMQLTRRRGSKTGRAWLRNFSWATPPGAPLTWRNVASCVCKSASWKLALQFRRSQSAATETSALARMHDNLDTAVRALFFDRAVRWRPEFRRAVTTRLDLHGTNSHRLDQILFYAISAALAQIEVVLRWAEWIRIALDRKCCPRVALDERAKLLQLINGARLQCSAVIFEQLIVGHSQFCARSERTFLRQQLIQIAKARSAPFVRPGTVGRQFARESIRPLDCCAGASSVPLNAGCGRPDTELLLSNDCSWVAFALLGGVCAVERSISVSTESMSGWSTFGWLGKTSRTSSGIAALAWMSCNSLSNDFFSSGNCTSLLSGSGLAAGFVWSALGLSSFDSSMLLTLNVGVCWFWANAASTGWNRVR